MRSYTFELNNGDTLRGFKEANRYIAQKMRDNGKINSYPANFDNMDAVNDATTYLRNKFGLKYSTFSHTSEFLTNGTTDGFVSCIKSIRKKSERFCEELGLDKKPVMLMPVPTYGVFFEIAKNEGYDIWPIKRNATGTADLNDLKEKMQKSIHENRYVGAYFDSNPNNPTGAIRNKEETAKINSYIAQLNTIYQEKANIYAQQGWQAPLGKTIADCESFSEIVEIEPPRGIAEKTYLIDDIVYVGTEYDENRTNREMGLFLHFDDKADHTITLMGPSKIGLANIRSGLVIAPSTLYEEINKELFLRHSGVSHTVADAMTAAFSDNMPESYKEKRSKHIQNMAQDNQERGLMMKALFNGLNQTIGDAKEKERIRKQILHNTPYGQENHVKEMLKSGIAHVNITSSPAAGFFHTFDFSDLKGKSFKDDLDIHDKPTVVEQQKELSNYLFLHDIDLRPPQMMGLPETELTYCATFAINKEDIVGFAIHMDNTLKNVIMPTA